MKSPSKLRITLGWTAVVLWASLIFFFSAQRGGESGGTSRMILEWFRAIGLDLTALFGQYAFYVVRKSAHFTEYFILCLLLQQAIRPHGLVGGKIRLMAWSLAVLYACTDETHQYFVPGRTAAVTDVLIDGLGAGLGVLIGWAFGRFRKK